MTSNDHRYDQFSQELTSHERNVVALLDVPAMILDRAGRIAEINVLMCQMFSGEKSEMLGRSVFDFLKPPFREQCADFILNYSPGHDADIPFSGGSFTGGSDAGLTVKPMPVAAGVTAFLCQSQASFDKDDQNMRFFLERCDQGVWDFDAITGKLHVSDIWRRMRGLGPDDPIEEEGRDWLEDVHDDDRTALSEEIDKQIRGEVQTLNIQYRQRHKAGHWVWILCRGSVTETDNNGLPTRLVGTDTDISEIKSIEENLSRLAGKFQLAIEASGMGIWEYNATENKVHWDQTMMDLYGVTDGQSLRNGDLWETYLHPDDYQVTVDYSDECLREQKDFKRDFRIVRQDGEVRFIRSMSRLHHPDVGESRLIGINMDVTDDYRRSEELEAARKKLEHDSKHDALTGLANRRFLDELADAYFSSKPDDARYAVLLLDLDHFKEINDSLGHGAGDAVLVSVARDLRQIIGDRGLVCRVGGDEFSVFVENAFDLQELIGFAEEMLRTFRKPINFEGHACSIGLSVGIAISDRTHDPGSRIFAQADMALYEAKNAGRSCYQVYDTTMQSNAATRHLEHQRLLDAISAKEIICYYQPKFHAHDLTFAGAEALARWDCPDAGILTPDRFIPLSNEVGITARIDECILDRVLADKRGWSKAGIDPLEISLNVSQERLSETFLSQQLLDNVGRDSGLTFELLESAFLDHTDEVATQNLAIIRDLNIGIELDDFGSGHASILAMQRVKPTRIKIDRNLVIPVLDDDIQMKILRHLIRIAKLSGIQVVAEGLETPEHIKAMQTLGCDYLQGYALARPMSAEKFKDFLIQYA
ncbi:EAL domain-containing protein [Aestuariibius sp. HNIBRBA575]|uniref:EAL domain-containing protein n=1 Tax=Aestuariibius sp. HNIBRBA575 TaxID=3233343 RepID=UPI0034A35A40